LFFQKRKEEMTTVLFVHGTGTREPRHSQVFTQEIKKSLKALRSDLNVESCFWGEKCGAKLHAGGASIPLYDTTRGSAYTEKEIALWGQLYRDPFYELRALAIVPSEVTISNAGRSKAGVELDRQVRTLTISSQLQAELNRSGISEFFLPARAVIVSSTIYIDAIKTISQSADAHRIAIGRAIVAEALLQCKKKEVYAPILIDSELRDEMVQSVIQALGGSGHKVRDRLLEELFRVAGTVWVEPHRGAITDATYPFAGDILLYQLKGKDVCQYILNDIKNVQSPVVLLAHSLGGVACVDLLIEERLGEQVPLLITVGSQAPFFYEIKALHNLEYPHPLPPHFPDWLNIYDQRDVLAFVGKRLFGQKVDDVLVDNDQPFPQTHSAYWRNKETWEAIARKLRR
jgi:hypothetical protein